jgi:hypothetical protein
MLSFESEPTLKRKSIQSRMEQSLLRTRKCACIDGFKSTYFFSRAHQRVRARANQFTDAKIPFCSDHWFSHYVTSFYFVYATMTTVGYGDINAVTVAERCPLPTVVPYTLPCVQNETLCAPTLGAWLTHNLLYRLAKLAGPSFA